MKKLFKWLIIIIVIIIGCSLLFAGLKGGFEAINQKKASSNFFLKGDNRYYINNDNNADIKPGRYRIKGIGRGTIRVGDKGQFINDEYLIDEKIEDENSEIYAILPKDAKLDIIGLDEVELKPVQQFKGMNFTDLVPGSYIVGDEIEKGNVEIGADDYALALIDIYESNGSRKDGALIISSLRSDYEKMMEDSNKIMLDIHTHYDTSLSEGDIVIVKGGSVYLRQSSN